MHSERWAVGVSTWVEGGGCVHIVGGRWVCPHGWREVGVSTVLTCVSFPSSQTPEISMHLSDETIITGRSVTFRCQLAGMPHPSPCVEWSHNGARLTIDRAFASFGGEESCVLRINEVEEGDDGEYTCTVSNTEGMVTSTARLSVISE